MSQITVVVEMVPEALKKSLDFYLMARSPTIPFKGLSIEAGVPHIGTNCQDLTITWTNGHSADDGREVIAAFVCGWYVGRDALLLSQQKYLETQRMDCPNVSESKVSV